MDKHDHRHELHGYLTCGKYYVNDYEIHIERVADGMMMRIKDGNTGEIEEVVLTDGKPGMTDDEIAAARDLFDRMAEALTEWTGNEEGRQAAEKGREEAEAERVAAEAAREMAENGDPNWDEDEHTDEENEEHKLTYRRGLYELMLALYKKLHPGVDDTLEELRQLRDEAKKYRDEVNQNLYYWDGDMIQFNASGSPGAPGQASPDVVAESGVSSEFNANGYAAGSTRVHIKFPAAKRLDKITNVEIESMMLGIYSPAGNIMTGSSVVDGVYNYKGHVTKVVIDKVQNTIGLIFQRTNGSAYSNITGKESIHARCAMTGEGEIPAVSIRLIGEPNPATAEEEDEDNA